MMSTQLHTEEQKGQFMALLATYPDEVAGLRAALVEGRIDGRNYDADEDDCGCVIGTIAYLRGVTTYEILAQLDDVRTSDVEALIYPIHPGDTPATNPISALLVLWIDQHAVDTKGGV